MRIVLQRVSSAEVVVDGESISRIDAGLLLYVGIEPADDADTVSRAARRLVRFRVFEDQEGRTNLSVADVGGEVLVVSQFTLAASTRRGHRPSFHTAAAPERAAPLCSQLARNLQEAGLSVKEGRFGASMRISSCNEGPVTYSLEF